MVAVRGGRQGLSTQGAHIGVQQVDLGRHTQGHWCPAQHNQPDFASKKAATTWRIADGHAGEAQGRRWLNGLEVLVPAGCRLSKVEIPVPD